MVSFELTTRSSWLLWLWLCSDAGEPVVDSVVYLMDVLEEVGPDLVRRCYWDFGDWSDLWREFKTLPMDGSLEVIV